VSDLPLYITVGLAGIASLLALLCAWLWHSLNSYRARVGALHDEVVEVAASSAFGRRVAGFDEDRELSELGGCVNQLIEALHVRDGKARKKEEIFKDLANTLLEVVLIHNDKVLFANREAGELLGVEPEYLIGKNVTDLIRPAYRARARKLIEEQLDGKKAGVRYELQLIDGEERTRWAEATGMRMHYRDQPAVLTVARDISYRKSVEATLGHGRAQAQITLESLTEGVITTDTKGLIDYMNAAAEKLTGVAREQALAKPFAEVVRWRCRRCSHDHARCERTAGHDS